MKTLLRVALFVALAGCAACEQPDEPVLTRLTVRLIMPDSRPVERIDVLSGKSYLYDINTFERLPFPAVEGNAATVQLRKGVYTLIVDAEATYADGKRSLLRNADYNQTAQALTWTQDAETVVLLMKTVKEL